MVKLLNSLYLGASTPDDYGKATGVIELLPFDLYLGAATPSGVRSINVLLSGVSPLTLLNAISLNYVKAFGKCEQRNLPSDYVELESLTSSAGTGAHINTGVKAASTVKAEFVCDRPTPPASGTVWQVCSALLDNNGQFAIFESTNAQGGKYIALTYGVASGSLVYVETGSMTKSTFVIDDGVLTYDNGAKTVTSPQAGTTFTTNNDIWLFSRENTSVESLSSVTIYSAKFWDNGVLVRNLVCAKRKSDNKLGMYDLVNDNFIECQGTFTTGAAVVPSPDAPVDIVCNNGVIKYGKPITLDSTRYYAYFSDRGNWVYSGDSYSIVIPVEVGQKYKITADTTTPINGIQNVILRWGFIDNLPPETWKQTSITPSPTTMTIYDYVRSTPQNTPTVEITATYPYLVIQMGQSIFANNIANGRILLAEQTIYYDGTQEVVTVSGKNLFTTTGETKDKFLNASGVEQNGVYENYQFSYTDYLPVLPNTTYTLSVRQVFNTTLLNHRIHEYTENKTWIKQGANLLTQSGGTLGGVVSATFTTSATTKWLRINYVYNPAGENPQLEQGSTATTYEPYFNGGTATCQPLLSVGTYKDLQNITSGSVTRNVGIKVLTGEEDWSRNSDRASLSIPDILNGSNSWMPICTHYKAYHGGTSLSNMDDNSCKITSGGKSLLIKDTTHNTSLTDFTDYLKAQMTAGTPVIVVYPLATPTTETVTGQTLTITQGTNIVTAEGSVDDLELEVSYKAAVTVTVEEIEAVQLDENVVVTIE